jgi:hypothetical protein
MPAMPLGTAKVPAVVVVSPQENDDNGHQDDNYQYSHHHTQRFVPPLSPITQNWG